MQQIFKQEKGIGAVDYFESYRTVQQIHLLDIDKKDQFLHEGFTFEQVQNLMDIIDIDTATLCFILNINGFEFKKFLEQRFFSGEMCVKILAVAEVYAYGYHTFRSRRLFNYWMKSEVIPRGVISNLSFLCCPDGIKEVVKSIKSMDGLGI